MPKKRDPILAVLAYFQTAPGPAIEIALALVKDIVKQRLPGPAKKAPKRKKVTQPAAPPPQSTNAAVDAATASAVGGPKPPRAPRVPRGRVPEEDRPLPGMPGPQSTVGG
jgi:hypothetical protein